MIPSNIQIRGKLNPSIIQYILLNDRNYFQLANEYSSLHKTFVKESLLEHIMLWFDMIISPLITIFKSIFRTEYPGILDMLSMQKCVTMWKDWIRMKELQKTIREWISIVRSIGGPFISSNDAEYHIFVYADAMQRISDSILTGRDFADRRRKY